MKNPLYWASVHDIHLFHNKTPTEKTLESLEATFPDTTETGELDVIFIPGDLFDQSVSFHDARVMPVLLWMERFLRMCAKRDIVVRLLEGTPYHEWRQSQKMALVQKLSHIDVDFRYVDTLSIEYIESLGIHVLYVPDEWRADLDQVWVEVQELLQSHGLTQVDYTVMHGAFEYQLPQNIGPGITHQRERYESITRYHILVGHVHTASFRGKVIASGSFDRLKHKEEEAKGHSRGVQYADGTFTHRFIENEQAMRFVTLHCQDPDLNTTLQQVDDLCQTLPEGSYVSIEASDDHPIRQAIKTLTKTYPLLHFTTKSSKSREVDPSTLIELRQNYQPMAIHTGNIQEILMTRLKEAGYDDRICARAKELIDEQLGRHR